MTYILVRALQQTRFPPTSRTRKHCADLKYSIYRIVGNQNHNIRASDVIYASVVVVHSAYYSVLSRLYYYTNTHQEHDDVFTLTTHHDTIPGNNIVFSGKWEELPSAIQAQQLVDKL